MRWKSTEKDVYKLSIVNCTMLVEYDKQRCTYCGYYGCSDRGYTVTTGNMEQMLNESELAQQAIASLEEVIDHSWLKPYVRTIKLTIPQCVRKLKKSNAEALVEKIQACGDDCRRSDSPCPYRNEESVCQRNVNVDGTPLKCLKEDDYYVDCPFHEHSFSQCRRRRDGQCTDLLEKYNAADKKDILVLLAHRFSAAPCKYCNEGICSNELCQHHEGACTLQGLMVTCEQYEAVDPGHAYTKGVCTYVSSKDGKNDCKIFPTSNYAYGLSEQERTTLCFACRISHFISKATGLKCLGVRRTTSNPFLNQSNPLADHAIQINYLHLTHPQDVEKLNSKQIAQAVIDALTVNCEGLQCEEYQTCCFNPM